MNIIKIEIFINANSTDIIYLYTELPSPFPAIDSDNLVIKVETAKGYGVEYVKENFNIEPEIHNLKW